MIEDGERVSSRHKQTVHGLRQRALPSAPVITLNRIRRGIRIIHATHVPGVVVGASRGERLTSHYSRPSARGQASGIRVRVIQAGVIILPHGVQPTATWVVDADRKMPAGRCAAECGL